MKSKRTITPSQLFPTGVCELSVRYKRAGTKRVKVTSASDVIAFMREHFYDQEEIESREKFMVLFMDRANNIFAWECVSEGGMSGTVADPRMIFRSALMSACVSIVIAHNHPSGNNQPSASDIQLTKKLCEAGKVLEITVLDHIIVTVEGFYSFADEGLI